MISENSSSFWYFPNLSHLVEMHNEARGGKINSWLGADKTLLEMDDNLMNYAQNWAIHMSEKERLYHSSMKDIMRLGFNKVGENIAYGQKNEEAVMKTWMNSPGHRSNIMNNSFNRIGCGFSYSDNDVIYWCVCFGRI